MTLSVDTQVGPYQIVSLLGAGGMGEVYLARDSKLDRQVAIKVLPGAMTRDAERVARFEREAKLLASLNHPCIAAIYGFEEHQSETGAAHFIAMEYVEGETLAERLKSGAFAVEDALDVAKQMAEALEAAHDKGVIHRDLKPANVMIRPDGSVKVLDFGLAKAMADDPSGPLPADSPTITAHYTKPGVVLGTAAYMSPEQARGRPLDRRTDIWSFGVVLYECLSGISPFTGETISDSIGSILHKDVELDRLPKTTPPSVRHLIGRCLDRERSRRLQAIGEARIALESWRDEFALAPSAGFSRHLVALAPWLVAAAAVASLAVLWDRQPRAEPNKNRVVRTSINLPEGMAIGALGGRPAFSRDGTRLALMVTSESGQSSLAVRHLDSTEVRPLLGTEGAASPFWSPDGQWIGFFASGKLKKIKADGRDTPIALADAGYGFGGAWNERDEIVFSGDFMGELALIDAEGDALIETFHVQGPRTGLVHLLPTFLPGGDRVLFTAIDTSEDRTGVYIVDRETGQYTRIMRRVVGVSFVEPDLLVYAHEGDLFVSRFDPLALEVSGAVRIASHVGMTAMPPTGRFALSANGLIAYQPGASREGQTQVTLRTIGGELEQVLLSEGDFWHPIFSNDGKRIALDSTLLEDTIGDIWIIDIERGTRRRLTSRKVDESSPVWSYDDQTIYFRRGNDIHQIDLRSSGDGVPLVEGPAHKVPTRASRDGRWLAFQSQNEEGWDIHFVDLQSGETRTWLATPFDEMGAAFSPDGQWVAYDSDESGRREIYLRRFDLTGSAVPVSRGGARTLNWSADGTTLYFETLDQAIARVTIGWQDSAPVVGQIERLFQLTTRFWVERAFIDIAPDERGIVAVELIQLSSSEPLILIQNWQSLLDR